ncbi:MAG: hypothetical protein LUQ39_01435 [Methanomassiliicoccales archaeon]|nr:hypothetical protein [Methanomassiliicoccales archaeon]
MIGMNLTNESYLILIRTKGSTEYYYKDEGGWSKVSSRGRKYHATAEQVLNHILPALAGVKPSVSVEVEHYDDREARAVAGRLASKRK